MARVTIDDSILKDTADAIREKTGTAQGIGVEQFATIIASISGGGGDSEYFFQEYESASYISLNNSTAEIDLDADAVEWLVMFPMQLDSGGQYAFTGGVYIPGVFGRTERTSYGVSTFSIIGCGSGDEMSVSDGVLRVRRTNNSGIYDGVRYGIIGKAVS